MKSIIKLFVLIMLFILAGCSIDATDDQDPPTEESQGIVILNEGGSMEGYTPRGFEGVGLGLFTGDNVSSVFPEGDGTQIFLTFDLMDISAEQIESAELRSEHAHIEGTPFEDLGALIAEEVRYDSFSPLRWRLEPEENGASCEFATSPDGPFACDVTAAVNHSLADGHPYAQFRLRLTEAGDGDGVKDMVLFYITDPDTNEPGIFELEVVPGSE
jgi:hypothetical protein